MWFKIQGVSMKPTFKEGDKVITFKSKDYKPNDIVVIKDPGCFNKKRVIKRIMATMDKEVWVEGDNKNHSLDSRHVGWIKSKYIIGKVYGTLPDGKIDSKLVFDACYRWLNEGAG